MANRFKPGLNKEAEKILKEEEQQEELHRKHKEISRDKVIVERGPWSVIAKVLLWILKAVLLIAVIALVAVGIIALVYPEPRAALIDLWINILGELHLGG